MEMVSAFEFVLDDDLRESIEETIAVETVVVVLMKFNANLWSNYVETVNALQGTGANSYDPNKLDLDLKNRPNPPAKPSIEEPQVLELKQLPSLRYVFLGTNNTLPMIFGTDLNEEHVQKVIGVLQRFKKVIGWTIADIIRILPGFFTHKIYLEE